MQERRGICLANSIVFDAVCPRLLLSIDRLNWFVTQYAGTLTVDGQAIYYEGVCINYHLLGDKHWESDG